MTIDRKQVYLKCKQRCAYCGEKIEFSQMEVDHVFSKRQWQFSSKEKRPYPTVDDIRNLLPSCHSCNHYKRSYSLEGFRHLMKTLHKRIESHYINKVAIKYGIIIMSEWDGLFYFEKMKNHKKFKRHEITRTN